MTDPTERRAPVRGPIKIEDVPWKEWSSGARFSGRVRHLTRQFIPEERGQYHVGVAIEELQPGKQSCPAHYHLTEEEHVMVLEGTLTLRLGDEAYEMKAGDYVCFPAGQAAGHCLVNRGTAPVRYLLIGEHNDDEVAVYTDSNKFMVRQLGVFDRAAERNYWDGEKKDEPLE